jgi:hypothetical protein
MISLAETGRLRFFSRRFKVLREGAQCGIALIGTLVVPEPVLAAVGE